MKTLLRAALTATTISISACSGDPQLVADPPCHRQVSLAPQAAENCPARSASTQKNLENLVLHTHIFIIIPISISACSGDPQSGCGSVLSSTSILSAAGG